MIWIPLKVQVTRGFLKDCVKVWTFEIAHAKMRVIVALKSRTEKRPCIHSFCELFYVSKVASHPDDNYQYQ